jgi:RNA polymerase sigma factor (sigma-70 family)
VAEETLFSMNDARDVEDNRLLEAGEHKLLLANYFDRVQELCFLRLRNREVAEEAAQIVLLRRFGELGRGKRYSVPFRVVVWKVVDWTTRGFYKGAKQDATLPDDWNPATVGDYESVEDDYDFGLLIADLPERQRQVADLIYREGLSHEQAAERLGITRNAVDQALHNAHRKLAEKLGV